MSVCAWTSEHKLTSKQRLQIRIPISTSAMVTTGLIIVCLFLGATVVVGYGPDSSKLSAEWKAWGDSIRDLYTEGVAVYPATANEQFWSLCLQKYDGRGDGTATCAMENLAKFKHQRGKENGIFYSFKRAEGCFKTDVTTESGEIIPVYFDYFDNATVITGDILLLLNKSRNSEYFDAIYAYMSQKLESIPISFRHIVCHRAAVRRDTVKREVNLFETKMFRVPKIEVSSFKCRYTFNRKEWLLPEMNALIPLGNCYFENVYLHNNQWYFISDTTKRDDLPFLRLNTRSIEFRGLQYEFKPNVITINESLRLLQSSAGLSDPELKIKVLVQGK